MGLTTSVQFPAGAVMKFFSSSSRSDRFLGPPRLLSNGYRGLLPGLSSWPLTSFWCRGQECVELYLRSPVRLHGI